MMQFKEIDWNGISVRVPENWELDRIESRYLNLEDGLEGVMEIKWQTVKGNFSPRTQLKRLAVRQDKTLRRSVTDWQPPRQWRKALANFQTDGFKWRSAGLTGRGVLLFCKQCRTATLIQFFCNDITATAPPFLTILESFQDHRDDGRRAWSVFDIRAVLSEQYHLRDYVFNPGYFKLGFEAGGHLLTLFRWAPAAALLTDKTLQDFGVVSLGHRPENFETLTFGEHPAIAWQEDAKRNRSGRFGRWGAKPQPRYQKGQLWHVEDANRILGVQIGDKHPISSQMLEDICSSYAAI